MIVNGNDKCTDFGNRECSDFGNSNAPISVTTIHNYFGNNDTQLSVTRLHSLQRPMRTG